MSVTRPFHLCLATGAIALICCGPIEAVAQSRLPWADANPLEKLFGKPGEQRRPTAARRRPTEKAASTVPALTAVPVPEARPGQDAAAGVETVGEPEGSAAEPPKIGAAVPDATGKKAESASEGADAEPEDATSKAATDAVQEGQSGAAPSAAGPDIAERPGIDRTPSPDKAANGSAGGVGTPASDGDDSADLLPKDRGLESKPDVEPEPSDPAATAEKPLSEIPVPDVRPADAPAADPADGPPAAPGARPAVPATAVAPNGTEALKARASEISPATAVIAAAAIEDARLCEAELRSRGAEFTVAESISEGDCGVLRPVDVTRLSSGVKVSPDTQFLCRTALALDDWMTGTVIPAAKSAAPDDRITEFRHASTYVCRPRASENGISEHARGSAIDIAAFVFAKRPEIGIEAHEAGTPEATFQNAVRAGACGPFKTVLGPGTDADHATHFHLDIAARKNGSTYCK